MNEHSTLFKLPDLGEGLPDAEIHEWHVKVGDDVLLDQLLVSMETAKAVVDVPSPRSGKILKLYGQAGDTIQTGEPLVEYVSEESLSPPKTEAGATVAGSIIIGDTIIHESASGMTPQVPANDQKQTLPVIRLIAKKLGLDLAQFPQTGMHGEITVDDLCQVLSNMKGSSSSSPKRLDMAEFVPLKGVKKAMVQSMKEAHDNVVSVTLSDKADLHAWLPATDFTVRLIRAICVACQAEPVFNAHFDGQTPAIHIKKTVNLGVAVDTVDGLFVPVIKNANEQTPASLRETINRFKKQAQERALPPADLKDASITLSNFGTFAGYYASPVVVPPTVAIIGAGRSRDEVVPVNGQIEIHPILPLSLSFDHRAATGGEASRFLKALIDDLQQPE